MVRSVSVLFAVLLMSGAALAQTYPHENTPEDRACRGDARRFCKDDIPARAKSLQIEAICSLSFWWSMIFSENRYPLFGIML